MKQYPVSELEFLREGIQEIIKVRQILKNSYIFGYYLESGKEKQLFEYLQQDLEKNADHLHELLEKPMDPYLDLEELDKKPFAHFKSELTNYFQVTRTVQISFLVQLIYFSFTKTLSKD